MFGGEVEQKLPDGSWSEPTYKYDLYDTDWNAKLVLGDNTLDIEVTQYYTNAYSKEFRRKYIGYSFKDTEVSQISKYAHYGYANKYSKPRPVKICDAWEVCIWRQGDHLWNETKQLLHLFLQTQGDHTQ